MNDCVFICKVLGDLCVCAFSQRISAYLLNIKCTLSYMIQLELQDVSNIYVGRTELLQWQPYGHCTVSCYRLIYDVAVCCKFQYLVTEPTQKTDRKQTSL